VSERSPGRPLRGAIVGYGFIAERGHLPAYTALGEGRDDFEIVAVADVCAARRGAAERAIPGVRTYDDHASLLAAEGASLDFVDVTTPPARHAEIARAALDRGLHVLCEKPLATTAEDARRMLAHARAAGRVLYPGHSYKHAPVIERVRQILSAGQIGAVRVVTLQTFRTTHARGVDEWRPDWRRERCHAGGGIAMDHGSHTFYLAFEWLGGYPIGISATMSTLGGHDTEDNFACSIRFPAGMASAHLAWTAGARKVIYAIHGERGAIRVEDDELELITREGGGDRARVERESVSSRWGDASHAGWFRSLLEDFAITIDRQDYAGYEAIDAVRCVELIEAAYASARNEGREEPLTARHPDAEALCKAAE
jgi:predicted dehydrogenase